MQFEFSPEFEQSVASLPLAVRKKIPKTLKFFQQNFWHPSLHTEKLEGRMFVGKPIWSIRIDRTYRISFSIFKERESIFLINVSKHYE
ncbi:MAG: hypothetical protein KGZ58_09185 [Ignavibacteriales bacterium]|nr:hypothetical protein [Ignavibacteriales bacterium]